MGISMTSVAALLDVTARARTRVEYEAARLEWLARSIGIDSSYVGPASRGGGRSKPTVTGVSARHFSRCEQEADRYWDDRRTLNDAAVRAGGVVADHDVLSLRDQERMPFYAEIVRGHGIRATAVCMLQAVGEFTHCLYLGRTSRGARFDVELDLLREALPALALGTRLFDALPGDVPPARALPFTIRENEVLALLARGLTNVEIGALLGTSPFTVKNQVAAMLAKASVKNRTELVYLATRTSVESPAVGPAAK